MLRILCAAVMAFALSSPALARHRAHNHFNHHVKMVHQATDKRMFLSFGEATSARSASRVVGSVERHAAFSGPQLIMEARSYIGVGAIFGRSSLWCARFMNYVLQRAGYRGTGSDLARSFLSYGTRIGGPRIGAIAVFGRGPRSGHVGIVSAIAANGDPIIISGNHGHRVAEAPYPRARAIGYVLPNG